MRGVKEAGKNDENSKVRGRWGKMRGDGMQRRREDKSRQERVEEIEERKERSRG